MMEEIYNFFTVDEIENLTTIEEINESLIKIMKEFETQTIDYSLLFESYIYRFSFIKYLENYGYSYIKEELCELFEESFRSFDLNNENLEYEEEVKVKIIKFLASCNLIDDSNLIEIESNLNSEKKISYKKSQGLNKNIFIEFKSEKFPLKIENLEYKKNDFINVKYSKTKIKLEVKIPSNYKEEINIVESMIIYTNYKIEKFEFIIECCIEKEKDFFDSYDDYINFCKNDFQGGRDYYERVDFSKCLKNCDNKFANSLFENSMVEGKRLGFDCYELFLFYNGVEINLKRIVDVDFSEVEEFKKEFENSSIEFKDELNNNLIIKDKTIVSDKSNSYEDKLNLDDDKLDFKETYLNNDKSIIESKLTDEENNIDKGRNVNLNLEKLDNNKVVNEKLLKNKTMDRKNQLENQLKDKQREMKIKEKHSSIKGNSDKNLRNKISEREKINSEEIKKENDRNKKKGFKATISTFIKNLFK